MKSTPAPKTAADAIVARMFRDAIRSHVKEHGIAAPLHLLADLLEEPADEPVPVHGRRKSRRGTPTPASLPPEAD